jgi:hypothetical protein
VIEAATIGHAIEMASKTPCAVVDRAVRGMAAGQMPYADRRHCARQQLARAEDEAIVSPDDRQAPNASADRAKVAGSCHHTERFAQEQATAVGAELVTAFVSPSAIPGGDAFSRRERPELLIGVGVGAV